MSKFCKDGKAKPKSKSKSSHTCEYCHVKRASPSALDHHRRTHTNERPFSCNLCDYSTTQKSSLTVHIRRHLHEKPFKCPQIHCSYSASQIGTLKMHNRTVHLGEKRFECPVPGCGHRSGQKTNLEKHMTTHEENPEKPFKCLVCPYKAKRKSHLKDHMTNIHSKERKFKCPHSKEGCGFAGKMKRDLDKHIETHAEKTLTCPQPNCEFKTNTKRNIQRHMDIHSSELKKRHKCRLCEFSSRDLASLTKHIRTHTKERPYKCKIQGCLYQAKQSGKLNLHVRAVHEKLRPFKCTLCPYVASRNYHLKSHQKSKHPDQH